MMVPSQIWLHLNKLASFKNTSTWVPLPEIPMYLAWGSAWIPGLFLIIPDDSNVLPRLRMISLWELLRGQNKVDILIDRWFSWARQIAFFQFMTLASNTVVMILKYIPQPQTFSWTLNNSYKFLQSNLFQPLVWHLNSWDQHSTEIPKPESKKLFLMHFSLPPTLYINQVLSHLSSTSLTFFLYIYLKFQLFIAVTQVTPKSSGSKQQPWFAHNSAAWAGLLREIHLCSMWYQPGSSTQLCSTESSSEAECPRWLQSNAWHLSWSNWKAWGQAGHHFLYMVSPVGQLKVPRKRKELPDFSRPTT